MAVRNYTTKINVEKTIGEVEVILVKFGAGGIMKEYKGSKVDALMFYLEKGGQKIPFKIPMSLEKSRRIVENAVKEGKLPRRYLSEPLRSEQGERIAWRVIKDWIDSQLSLMEMNFAEPIEILLPYVYDQLQKQTLYDKFNENMNRFIALPEPEADIEIKEVDK